MGCACGKQAIEVNKKKYTVKSRLGEGGFSVVELIQDTETQRYYALKRIVCHNKDDERNAVQEVDYFNSFDQQNIIKCLGYSVAHISDFVANTSHSEVRILLPYYKCGTLQDELTVRAKTRSHIPEQRILHLFRQMCEGVRTMHTAQPHPLAHRDLKPANVLMTEDDIPVWMDFGSMGRARMEIRKAADALALQDLASEKCSMPYKPPELYNVESHCSIDERVDIWSLGCCLYAMCYFKSPFDAAFERGDSVALAVISGIIDFPEKSPYSGSLHGLIRSMLEVSSLQRPFIDGVIFQTESVQEGLRHHV